MHRVFNLAFWQQFGRDAIETITSRGLRILLVVVLYWIARQVLYRAIDAGLARMVSRQAAAAGDRAARLRTLQGLVKSIAGYALAFIALIMLLDAVGANVSGLITTAGVGGLAIGFGAQKLVRDVISGFFLMVEDQFSVGEYVTIGAATGVVEELGMRTTRVRDEQGRLWILSNGDISTVTNHSRAPVESFVEIGIAPAADVKRAQELIDEAGEKLYAEPGHALAAQPGTLGVSAFDAARTTLRVSVVAQPRAMTAEQMRVREAVRAALVAGDVAIA